MKDIECAVFNNQLVLKAIQVTETHDIIKTFNELHFENKEGIWIRSIPDSILELKNIFEVCTSRHKLKLVTHTKYLQWILQAKQAYDHDIFHFDIDIEHCTKLPLKEHQITAVKHFLTQKRYLMAIEMGLGKTAISFGCISALNQLTNNKIHNVLYILPSALKQNVQEEAKRFTSFNIHVIKNNKTKLNLVNDNINLIIISYGLLHLPHLKTIKWDMIIADECHFLKNAKTKRSKLFFELSKEIEYILLLTGTPGHKTSDYWHLLHILNPVLFSHFYTTKPPRHFTNSPKISTDFFYFVDRFVQVQIQRIKNGRFIYDFKKSKHIEELHALMKPYWIVQHLKDMITLPPLIQDKIHIGTLNEKKAYYFQTQLNKIKEIQNKNESNHLLNQLVLETSQLKQKYIWDYVLYMLESYQDKMILFFYYKEMGHFLKDHFSSLQKDFIFIDGDVKPDTKRYELIKHFKEIPTCQIALLSLACCSTGFNLAFVNLVLVTEIVWDSFYHKQSEGRCHRIGQTQKCIMQYLLLDNTTDKPMWLSLQSKLRIGDVLLS